MPDRWPKAFDQYVEDEKPRENDVETFQQLITNVGDWLQRPVSKAQIKATAKISERKLGIKPYEKQTITRRGKLIEIGRDLSTGRFVKRSFWQT